MASESGQKDQAVSQNDTGVKRRGLLRFGTLITALTGASAISAISANSAQAGPGDKTPSTAYIPTSEKGTALGVATLDKESKIPLALLPDISATYAAKSVETSKQDVATLDAAVATTAVIKNSTALQKVGDGADPNSSTTQNVKLLVTANRTNPDKVIEQHLVGYSFYSGTPAGTVGTLQGGSCESAIYANGSADWGTVLGFEGIGRADGDNLSRNAAAVIGNQGTAINDGKINVALLVSLRAGGPKSEAAATGVVAESRSLDIQEPLTGTLRRTLYGIGTHRFRKGTPANTVEVSNSSDVLKWAFSDALLKGYASDGTSVRVSVDTGDTPTTARFLSELFGSSKHISLKNNGGEVFWVNADGTLITGGTIKAKSVVTGSRPSASTAGVGSQMYDTTLSKPIWSDGTVWRDAMGIAV